MDPISTQQLQYFHALARHGNYARAAEALGLSQPALSRSIQSLERRIGAPLVERERGRTGISLTDTGLATLAHADEILARLDALRASAAEPARHRVAFGIGPQYATALLARTLTRIGHSGAAPVMDITIGRTADMLQTLLDGDLEFFISGAAPRELPQRVRYEKFGETALSLVVRDQHPLLQEAEITLEALSAFPVHTGSAFRDRVRLSEDRVQNALTPSLILDNYETLARITADSDGVLVAISGIATHPLVELDFDLGEVVGPSETFLFALREMRLSADATLMIDELRRTLHEQDRTI